MKKFIVLFAVLVVVFAFSAQAIADVSLYGSARFQTYSVKKDKEQAVNTAYDDTDTVWQLDSLTRFGAKFQSGDVGGLWEMDARSAHNNANTAYNTDTSSLGDLRIRHAYGTWNFGAGQLLVGQTWPLTDALQSNLQYTDSGMQWWGGLGYVDARITQIRLTFGNLAVAFLSPNVPSAAGGLWGGSDIDTTLPKVEVKYSLPLEPVTLNLYGGWQNYEDVNPTDQSKDVTSWVGAAQAKAKFGAAYVNFIVSYAVNAGDYGLGASKTMDDAYLNQAGTDYEDMETTAALLVVGFKVSDMVTIEGGYGKIKSEGDWPGSKLEDDAQAYYINATLTMAPGVYIVPEFAVFDKEDRYGTAGVGSATATEEGKVTVVGVFWKIDFK